MKNKRSKSDDWNDGHITDTQQEIEIEVLIALKGLKWLKDNAHEIRTYYGNKELRDNVLETVAHFNQSMTHYFDHWERIK